MSTTKFATWLRVTPPPTTLAESSAIFNSLKSQGRVTHFIKHARPKHHTEKSTTYYTVFSREPPSLKPVFEVPVYHNLPSPRDLDPFNIRGLQDRKPLPAPKTFICRIEALQDNEKTVGDEIKKANPYYGSFKVQEQDWLQTVYAETGAPPGVKEGLGLPDERTDEEIAAAKAKETAEAFSKARNAKERRMVKRKERRPSTPDAMKLDSLMDAWYEGLGLEKSQWQPISTARSQGSIGDTARAEVAHHEPSHPKQPG